MDVAYSAPMSWDRGIQSRRGRCNQGLRFPCSGPEVGLYTWWLHSTRDVVRREEARVKLEVKQ